MSPLLGSSGIDLSVAPKKYAVEQDKSRPPAETVAWVQERFAALGQQVLRKTMRIDTGRLDVPVYISLCGPDATRLTNTQKQMGKGASPVQAEASALMELAERFSFFSFIKTSGFNYATAPQVDGPRMDFGQVASSLHHPPDDLARAEAVYNLLPQSWCWARNLSQDREELIPLGWFYAINEYNGPAAGNCLEEAVLQSLCEVVERHVSAVVSNQRLRTPAIEFDSIADPVAAELLAKFQQAGIEVYLRDYTCAMGVPSVAALCYDPASFPAKSEIVYAAGTATSPAKALIRALTEVAQLAGDFETRSEYLVSALPKFRTLDEAAYVMQSAGSVALCELPDVSHDDFLQEVKACVAALAQRGYTLYTVNVSHPRLQVPAVYTIIPGADFAQRTIGTDVVFHAAKLASQLPDPAQALEVISTMSGPGGRVYFLPFFRGLALLNLGRAAEALAEFDQALKLDPPPSDAGSIWTQKGAALKDLGRLDEAKAALKRAAAVDEPHHEVFNLLGYCHFVEQNFEEAMEVFGRAIEIEPGAAINYANIGSCLRELGRIEEACRMYRSALELDPTIDFARENLARLCPDWV